MKHQSDASKADGAKSVEAADSAGCGDSSKGPKSPRMESQREDGSVQSLTRRADFFASRARHAEALPLVDEALRIEPSRPDLHLGRGQCLEHMEKLDEALLCYEAALRLDTQSMAAQRNKALLLARQQRWREAAGSFREVLRLELALPVQKEMRLELARCLTEDAIQLKAAGQPNLHGFHEAIQACETYAPAYFQLGVHYSEANNSAKAKEMYAKAVQLQPGYVEALNNLGVACRELGEWDHAVEAYALALKVNQNCSKTRENMAIALLQLGCRHLQGKELKQASKALKRGLSFNSRNADLYFNLGVLYAEKEKWDQAKVNYELAIHFDPRHANAHNNLGVIHSLLTGNPSDAWATSFTEAAKEWEAQRVASVPPASSAGSTTSASHRPSGRAALLEVERLSMIPSKSEARHLPETGEAIRCSLPRSCMHASSHELASRLAVHRPRTFETDLKTERGCTMDACEVM
ncbi:putative UDP-N-acetylglucosamine--peptide N-acetylglucosaminyltransferase SPINDLY [Symbiodinium microadriaticum]|uniref:Putative UDP-N-acetylglucosamine--peptide N-acetylglucosaminyltransferase SPINDLY n=1 Tax=Symbiodinium microadriaticum TaxID=2951 RepID=A0A1Q9EP27_SYMMI|nr:putative UDP-N-acetylglucosamine--peptide N-acetylglucosaminyltransferase SPINDLY [Symbiodinium microadriaticum]